MATTPAGPSSQSVVGLAVHSVSYSNTKGMGGGLGQQSEQNKSTTERKKENAYGIGRDKRFFLVQARICKGDVWGLL